MRIMTVGRRGGQTRVEAGLVLRPSRKRGGGGGGGGGGVSGETSQKRSSVVVRAVVELVTQYARPAERLRACLMSLLPPAVPSPKSNEHKQLKYPRLVFLLGTLVVSTPDRSDPPW